MKFRSKIDWWFFTMPLASILLALYLIRYNTILTIVIAFFSTYYILTDTHLVIKSGLLFRTKISYHEILSCRETRDSLFSPCLSLDRIEITYASNQVVLISPKNKKRFLFLLDEQLS